MLICSEVCWMNIYVGKNVQRLDDEDIQPISHPRAPNNFL